ncbi:DUF6270 domain-containing protein [Pseudomonas faucium]|uniref:DUF6270 domain-containing protein n=1 Tax=Pseudomonas faucium TaxID=2740518 RepID=UPI0039C3FDDE
MNKIRILILGSCVSRDALNFDIEGHFEILEYYARSSFASAFSDLPIEDSYTHALTSRFQANVVNADLQKTVLASLETLDFDLLLIDLIDERFKLAVNADGGICTISNELIATGFDIQRAHQIIEPNSEAFFDLWEKGWKRFTAIIQTMGASHKVLINRTFWSTSTSGGDDYASSFRPEHIDRANATLRTLYERMASDLPAHQFIDHAPGNLVGADDHRWGTSPFHYIDRYYIDMLKKIRERFFKEASVEVGPVIAKPQLDALSDREILNYRSFSNQRRDVDEPLTLQSFSGSARAAITNENPVFTFTGSESVYQIRFKLPTKFHGNGLHLRFRLSDWEKLNYLGVGYTFEGRYRHVKIVNAARNQWLDFSIGHNDLAYGIQNDWEAPSACDFQEIKLYFKGEPKAEGSTLEIERLTCWLESDHLPTWLTGDVQRQPLPAALCNSLYSYMEKCFKNASSQAEDYLQKGTCPLYGEVALEWHWQQTLPASLDSVGTYRFSWHALHPAIILMIHARQQNNLAPLFAAREFVSNWLERSYFNADEDRKFAWYDHGTAERLLAFLLIWDMGCHHQFDTRFMVRLRSAIFKHAQLLASEMFYASHQASRYHNHAWFQDMALLATSLAMPDFPCAERWQALALARLSDQLNTLIVRDSGYAVFVENSIGYHQGVQRLISFAGELAQQSEHQTAIPTVASELLKFSDFLRYPDNRSPAQGDTFRRANPAPENVRRCERYTLPSATILPTAGYAIVKGNHGDTAYMLSMFATSLCKTHKHEDNLSFTLFLDGIEWLIDPSFYSHEYLKPVQRFLRSAYAHNNPVVADVPYSIEPGQAQLTGNAMNTNFRLEGSHRAFAETTVSRHVNGYLDRLQLEVTDEINSAFSGNAQFSLFHCGDGVQVTTTAEGVTLQHPGSRYRILITSDSPCTLLNGWKDDHFVNATSGLGFMQKIETSLIAFEMKNGVKAKFEITAINH